MRNKFAKISLLFLAVILAVGGAVLEMKTPSSSAANVTVELFVPSPTCGNGTIEGGAEQCDDGNTVDGDGCDRYCILEVCGNGFVQVGEQCDDGNVDNTDMCLNTCRNASCGDTFLHTGVEQCDDGGIVNGDGCDSACYLEVCGNGRVQVGEPCDDGNLANGDGCTSTCSVEPGYVCSGSPSCCAVCGDNVKQCAEQCDDGKECFNHTLCTTNADCLFIGDFLCTTRSNDGCSATCTTEGGGGAPPPEEIIITQITAYPEQRSGASGTNYDTKYFFSVLTPDNQNHQIVYTQPTLLSTNNQGIGYPYLTLSGITANTYDITFKSYQHLTSMLDNVYLRTGENFLNFTNPANLPQIGSQVLTAGDIDNSGTSPSTLGDDAINSVDLSVMLQNMGSSDSSGNNVRANLNQDTVVDEADLNILLNNLDKEAGL